MRAIADETQTDTQLNVVLATRVNLGYMPSSSEDAESDSDSGMPGLVDASSSGGDSEYHLEIMSALQDDLD